MRFSTFIGIDQTGASLNNGKSAKPLPVCVARETEKGKWQVHTQKEKKPLTLPALTSDHIKDLLECLNLSNGLKKTALIADCVLGLPKAVFHSKKKGSDCLWNLFQEAAAFKLGEKEFGRDVAEKFFEHLLPPKSKSYPRRVCEVWSESNSVFRSKPYQKNIQTGTFRMWKELGQNPTPWTYLWPYSEVENDRNDLPWIFEGYPSLIWKDYLGLSHRNPKKLKSILANVKTKVAVDSWTPLEKYPDHADSFVLVWGAIHLQNCSQLLNPFQKFPSMKAPKREGWIMGLKAPREV